MPRARLAFTTILIGLIACSTVFAGWLGQRRERREEQRQPQQSRQQQQAGAGTLHIDWQSTKGPVPSVLLPSAFNGFAGVEANQRFIAIAPKIGLVRISIEPVLTAAASLEEFEDLLDRRFLPAMDGLKQMRDKGAKINVLIARTPSWLATKPLDTKRLNSGWPVYQTLAPTDADEWAKIVAVTVKYFNKTHGFDAYYECWNEPNGNDFFRGTSDDYLRIYKAFVKAARTTDPKAKVGGPSPWRPTVGIGKGKPGEPTAPIIQQFISYASKTALPELKYSRLPVDFVSFHYFDYYPPTAWQQPLDMIRSWLKQGGYPKAELIVNEWNLEARNPADKLDRDSEVAAAYLAASVHAMWKAGLTYQCIAALQDFLPGPNGQAFYGGYGVMTMKPLMPKAPFHVLDMFGRISNGQIVDTRLEHGNIDVANSGLGAIAVSRGAASGGKRGLGVLIWNYTGSAEQIAMTAHQNLRTMELQNNGAWSMQGILEELGIEPADLSPARLRKTLMEEQKTIASADLPPDVRSTLMETRQLVQLSKRKEDMTIPLRLDFKPALSGSYRVQYFVVDKTRSNAFRAQSGGKGVTKGDKLDCVVDRVLDAGNIPTIDVADNSVHLILIDPAN